jgi:hypothetical protein
LIDKMAFLVDYDIGVHRTFLPCFGCTCGPVASTR